MDPRIERNFILRRDRNRIPRPEVDQRPFETTIFDQQFVAATGRIGPSSRTMKDDRTLFFVRCFQPKGNAERFVPRKIADRQINGIIPRKLDRVVELPSHHSILTSK